MPLLLLFVVVFADDNADGSDDEDEMIRETTRNDIYVMFSSVMSTVTRFLA